MSRVADFLIPEVVKELPRKTTRLLFLLSHVFYVVEHYLYRVAHLKLLIMKYIYIFFVCLFSGKEVSYET